MHLSRTVIRVALLSVLGVPQAFSETGAAAYCLTPVGASAVSVAAGGPPYGQPLALNVMMSGIDAQSLEAQRSGNVINVTLTGTTRAPQAGACGTVRMNPMPAGTYTLKLYVARNGQSAALARQRDVEVSDEPAVPGTTYEPYEPTPETPPLPGPPAGSLAQFAPTQAVGEIEFHRSVSSDGAAQINIPLWVPPGRQGLQPNLALTYSSRSGNGALGVGWSLSGLPSITACRRTPAADGAYGGRYPDRLCLDGQRLIEVGRNSSAQPAMVEYRTEVDSDRKIIGHWRNVGPGGSLTPDPDWLEVFNPDGTILHFGTRGVPGPTVAGQLRDCTWGKPIHRTVSGPGATIELSEILNIADVHAGCTVTTSQGRVWMLGEMRDRFGNRMEIDYESGEGMLPAEIKYTFHAEAAQTKSVHFGYEGRLDVRVSTLSGVAYTYGKRLKTIDMSGPLGLSDSTPAVIGVLRRYTLEYDIHPTTRQSLLTRVTECAGDDASAACLAPLVFSYGGALSFADIELASMTSASVHPLHGFAGFRTGDFNGDGLDDLLYRNLAGMWALRLSTGTGLGPEVSTGIAAMPDDGRLGDSFVNLNRDSAVDAVVPQPGDAYAFLRGNAAGAFQATSASAGLFIGPVGTFLPEQSGYGSRIVAVGDMNGDSRPDLLVSQACRRVQRLADVRQYITCRWGVALNQTQPLDPFNFTNAMDFKSDTQPCTEHAAINLNNYPGFVNCFEAEQNNPAFILDADGNGQNELIVPVRRLTTDTLPGSWREQDHTLELRSLGFPAQSASTARRTGLSSKRMTRVFMDVNGDSLADHVYLDGGVLRVAMNVGGSFAAPVDANVSAAAIVALERANELRVGDLNGDSLEDLYLVADRFLLRSTGQLGFEELPLAAVIPAGANSCFAPLCDDTSPQRWRWDALLDFNGDGLVDVLQMRGGKAHVLVRIGGPAGLLQKVTGGRLTPELRFGYQTTQQVHTPMPVVYPQYALRRGMWFVAEVAERANVREVSYPAGFNRTTYTYAGGRFDARGRGWLGVSERTEKDEQTGATLKTEMDNAAVQRAVGLVDVLYRYAGAFRPKRETAQSDSRAPGDDAGVLRRVVVDYDYADRTDTVAAMSLHARSSLAEVRRTVSEAPVSRSNTTAPVFTPLASRRQVTQSNDYGVVTYELSQSFDGGFDVNNAVPATASVSATQIDRTPTPVDAGNWLIRRIDREVMTGAEPARAATAASATEPARPASLVQLVRRTTDFRWKAGTTSIERITVEPVLPVNASLNSVTTLEYGTTGNLERVLTTADAGAGTVTREVRFAWDALDQTLIDTTTNSLQQSERTVYFAGLGLAQKQVDVNGLGTRFARDRFGRVRRLTAPSGNYSDIDYEERVGQLIISTKEAGGKLRRRYTNAWSQVTREDNSLLHGEVSSVYRTFTRLGQLATETLASFENDAAPERFAYRYDNLGQLLERAIGRAPPSQQPGTLGSRDVTRDVEQWSYNGLTTRHQGARGMRTDITVDSAGRIRRSAIVDAQSGAQLVSRLDYRPFGNLEVITDPKGHRTVFEYDTLGRRVSVNDPSSRLTTTGYNGFGELASSSSAAGESMRIERDLLGRIREERHTSGGTTRTAMYVWDLAANGIGQLAEVTSTDQVQSIYSYDKYGRPSATTWVLPGHGAVQRFEIATEWDKYDRPSLITYPAVGGQRIAVRRHYEPEGSLYKLTNATSGEEYWSLRAQDATGIALTTVLGGDMTTRRMLDARKRLKYLETLRHETAPQPRDVLIQKLAYDYGRGNLIRSRHDLGPDAATRVTEDYAYDPLGRLTTWTVYQGCSQSTQQYGYDDLGNLSSVSVLAGEGRTATLQYGPSATSPNAGPCAPRELTEAGTTVEFQYDREGRRVAGGGTTIDWNEFDLPRSVTAAGVTATYDYDAGHRRTVMRIGTAVEKIYIGGLYERRTAATSTQHVFNVVAPTGVVAQITLDESRTGVLTAGLMAQLPDVLGSPDTVVGANNMTTRARYEPYGQRRYPWALTVPARIASTSSVGFTGHEPEDETGFVNMRGRIYDPSTMRFLTADPILRSPHDARALNRYAYVMNNPVNFTDPSGFDCGPLCIDGPGPDAPPSPPPQSGPRWGEPALCGYGNPYNCATPNSEPNIYGSAAPQTPTKADATRASADAGTGLTTDQILAEGLDPDHPEKYGIDSTAGRVGLWLLDKLDRIGSLPGSKLGGGLLVKTAAGPFSPIVMMNAHNTMMPSARRAIEGPQAAMSTDDMRKAALKLLGMAVQWTANHATITTQVVEDSEGLKKIIGVVTGNDHGEGGGPIVRGAEVARDLEDSANAMGIDAEFRPGGRTANLHSEGVHHMMVITDKLKQLSETFTNRQACSDQCGMAQEAINAVVIFFEKVFE